ncbi:hypothetical protein THASP1DRAFT_26523 [Thamnocephalis sphaerospora]|uniref:Uncharacterized protein n=1 Tax=Thamnocephalis sphaerospora TaxID=78915 RepID=A0A4P9XI42_9FUNG|nr:hypothetical protein THASP1DRAFT_26523 [Thamnocephalis sphaerospora]|eukprot:RKP04910.1 hypothetical protein THASP1DRAFT_26523 [Thamnocephalis sphaerospora]
MERRIYKGHCNVETVKDVNFYGPRDEFIVSGSDDGNLFFWEKETGKLVQILKGDSDVVNVIEGHPFEPTAAVSGIDSTIKIFSPVGDPGAISPELLQVEAVLRKNEQARRHGSTPMRITHSVLRDLAAHFREESAQGGGELPGCAFQ